MNIDLYYKIVLYVCTILFGLCIGSFLNVVIYRVPENMSLSKPPSHCPKCNNQIKWYDNIPVLSYLILGGKCRYCKEKISVRYPLVELANALMWLLSVYLFWEASFIYAIASALACTVSICIFFIDLEHKIIPDRFQIIFGILCVVATIFDPFYSVISHIVGGVVTFVCFLVLALIFKKAMKVEALGGGDIKFSLVMGFFLGWQKTLLAVLIASLSASIILLIVRKKNGDEKNTEYPFGPFLTAGFVLSLFFGNILLILYTGLY